MNPFKDREEPVKDILDNQIFWDTIMMEHAQFVRGLLDPTEVELFNTANDLAEAFEDLIEITKKPDQRIYLRLQNGLEIQLKLETLNRQAPKA